MKKNNKYITKTAYMQRKKERIIIFFQIGILFFLIVFWELIAFYKIVDPFLISSPSRVLKTIFSLHNSREIYTHIYVTFLETICVFILSNVLGFLVSLMLWWFDFLEEFSRPYFVIFNALPKLAFGPIIIAWQGAEYSAIITLSLFISLTISILNLSSAFKNTDEDKILLMKTFGATKFQIFNKIVLPINVKNILTSMRINIGMTLIGVITGEFLVSKKGLGYLIIYGGQVFKLDLVMTSILILCLMALVFYLFIFVLEKILNFKNLL